MKRGLIKYVHLLLAVPAVVLLTYLLASSEVIRFPYIYVLLVSIVISIISLFIIPRYIRKSFESGDKKKLVISIFISIAAALPFILALISWLDYAL